MLVLRICKASDVLHIEAGLRHIVPRDKYGDCGCGETTDLIHHTQLFAGEEEEALREQ